jgi:hypothetical protein
MYSLPVKQWLHEAHLHGFHDTGHRIVHVISNERFWLFAMVVALLALLIAFMLLGMFMGGSGAETGPVYPFL